MSKRPLLPLLAALALGTLFLPTKRISAQVGSGPPPIDATKLVNAYTALVGGDPAAAEELAGLGHKFELYGIATDSHDPQNVTNDVVQMNPQPLPCQFCSTSGVAIRRFPPGIKITALTNQLSLKYYFPIRTCSGGSPRVQLAIDRNGDGSFDGNAFGYVGHGGFGTGCVTGTWDYVDLTDAVPFRWDLTQLGLGYHNWQSAVGAITSVYPNHKVLSAALVDDSAWDVAAAGQAYYDLFTAENRTMEQDMDTVQGN